MKNSVFILITVIVLVVVISIALSNALRNGTNEKEVLTMKNPKTLIVYYSRTGNTRVVAELIQEKIGGDLIEIQTKTPRPQNYKSEVRQNEQEQNEKVLPELKSAIDNFNEYDRIFIGFPTWNMALPQVIVTFLKNYDFSDKTVIPFNTNGGYGAGSAFSQIKSIANEATILEGLSLDGGRENEGILLDITGYKRVEVSKKIDIWLEKNLKIKGRYKNE